MDPAGLVIFLGGALAAGFVAGLTGFGTALIALAIWLHVMPPVQAVPLAAASAVAAHLTTLARVRHGVHWPRLWPFLAGGAVGLPLGVALLPLIDAGPAKLALGLLLVLYALYGLAVRRPPTVRGGGRLADAAVGAGGGFLGGLASLSGPLPTIWAGLRGWSKDAQRGVYQPFNLAVLLVAALGHAAAGRIAATEAGLVALALGATVAGALAGLAVYLRVSDAQFRRYVLVMLALSGAILVAERLSVL